MSNLNYAYTEDYQYKIASVIIRDPGFLSNYPDVVDPSYFDYKQLTSIVRLCKSLFEKFGVLPTKSTLIEALIEENKFLSKEDLNFYLLTIDQIYDSDISDAAVIQDTIVQFGKRQALRKGILKIAALSNESPEFYSKARPILESVLCVGENVNSLGRIFFNDVEKLPELLAVDSTYALIKRVPSMLPTLDKLTYGGPGRKQVWVVMGLPGGGKSTTLVNFGAAALIKGLSVVHYTLGDLQEVDVELRYAARLTGVTQEEILKQSPDYLERIRRFPNNGCSLLVRYFPSQTATIGTLKSHLTRYRSVSGNIPSLVVVDYADELAEMGSNDPYRAADRVYAGLNQLAVDFDVLIWTASQVNRYSVGKGKEDLITKFNIADSWAKAMKADGAISINQNAMEYENNRGRIWIDKVRRGVSFRKFSVMVNHATSTVKEQPSVALGPRSVFDE